MKTTALEVVKKYAAEHPAAPIGDVDTSVLRDALDATNEGAMIEGVFHRFDAPPREELPYLTPGMISAEHPLFGALAAMNGGIFHRLDMSPPEGLPYLPLGMISEKSDSTPRLELEAELAKPEASEMLSDFAQRVARQDVIDEGWRNTWKKVNRENGFDTREELPASNALVLKRAISDDPRTLAGVPAGAYELKPIDKALLATCTIDIEKNTIEDPAHGRHWAGARLLGETPSVAAAGGVSPRHVLRALPPAKSSQIKERVAHGDWSERLREEVIPDFVAQLGQWSLNLGGAKRPRRPSQNLAISEIRQRARDHYTAEYKREPPSAGPDEKSIREILLKEFPTLVEEIKRMRKSF